MPAPAHDEASALALLLAHADPANGDDAAVLDLGPGTCVSTDSTVAGVHAPQATPPHALGRRAVGRALSDLAAMGATPEALTCAVLVPTGGWQHAVEALAGARERAEEQGARVVGGDLTASGGGPLALVVTVIGAAAGPGAGVVTRGGASPGQELWVTGSLGAATGALARGDAVLPEPPDRLAAGAVLARHAAAMLDLSDGIARDARHLASASGCHLVVDLDLLPLAPGAPHAAATALGGDDYELLLLLDQERLEQVRADLRAGGIDIPLTRIGAATDGTGSVSFRLDGAAVALGDGFGHR
ncbi:MAG: thiamine monophosphate kinase [Thermoleophilia bacterium]|nr:thiamine monophosphate kinase [Thermoleophilia bacterium]